MRRLVLPTLALVLALSACGGGSSTVTVTRTETTTRTVTVTTATTTAAASPCLASALAGAFSVVQGSAGAGQISYRLRLTNQGDSPCVVAGIPTVQLVGRDGAALPTSVSAARPGEAAARVELRPGDAAAAEARFSPDVPGVGDQTPGQCEPTAATLRVTIGAGTLDAPISPPTPVCERGSLSFSNLAAA